MTTLLTGSTGFIGQYVLRDLLRRNERVVVLMRGLERASRLRLASIMRPLDVAIEQHLADRQLIIAAGVLPDELPAMDWGRTDRLVHCAACLQVDSDREGEPFRTNVEGTRALTDWAQRHHVPHFYLVSTAYTCGRNCKTALEQMHVPQPRFETAYELSKWGAEAILHNWASAKGHQATILRPSLVAGDYHTGYATRYVGFYLLARVIDRLAENFRDRRHNGTLTLPLRIPARPEARQNVVPVDYVSAAIVEIVTRPDLAGRIYHLTNPSPPSNLQIKEWLEAYYQIRGGRFVERLDRSLSESLAEDVFLQTSDKILHQLNHVPEFDSRNTAQALSGSGIECPQLDARYMFALLQFARRHKWGRASRAVAS
jgi:nucleoside-diphosphate-sugar epimerase